MIGITVTIIFLVIITLLSLTLIQLSGSFGPVGGETFYRVVAYSCLAFPLPLARPRLTTWVILGAIACGGSIELIQYLLGWEASLGDFVANGIGAIVGVAIARQLGLWFCRSSEPSNVIN